ncbi:Hypothetical_protein [Hexamita inflata]|uniref:Hypothetical_protein n=1 Tax=Hexamita inflata TaxID=28002 RepID=A0AA86PTZ7_9EUKA|nr:Hypothetical protein HINF_LOCUS32578 [Hexamita inflata]
MLIFEEYFQKRGLQLKWIPKSDMKNELKTARFALTYRPFDIFWEINRGSVSEQGWGSAFEVMQYLRIYLRIIKNIIMQLQRQLPRSIMLVQVPNQLRLSDKVVVK